MGCGRDFGRLVDENSARMQLGELNIRRSRAIMITGIDGRIVPTVRPEERGMRIVQERRQPGTVSARRKSTKLDWIQMSGICRRACAEA